MKIEIDVSDFYLDEGYSLEEGLKKYIIHKAISSIYEQIKDKIEKEIKQVVEKYVLEGLSTEISKVVETGKIKSRDAGREGKEELITISKYVQECLVNSTSSSWQSFDKIIRDVSKNFCDEMKRRYDISFASNIVAKLIDNKLIKDDAIKMLLGENKVVP